MKKTIAIYGITLAVLAIALNLINYYYTVHFFSTELYIMAIALLFTALGIWAGRKLTQPNPKNSLFEKNEKAIEALGLTVREMEVLELIAEGHSNKQIADELYISIHTVKTHVSNLLSKLDARRRTEAVSKAKSLKLIP